MDLFKSLIIILLSSVLINNYVLSRFLGICPFLGVSKNPSSSVGMGNGSGYFGSRGYAAWGGGYLAHSVFCA